MRNRWAGTCYRCGGTVKAQEGHFDKFSKRNRRKHPDAPHHAKWLFQHAHCAIKYRGTDKTIWLQKLKNTDTNSEPYGAGNIKTDKKVKNMSDKITLKNVRVVYPKIADKGSYEGKENDKFSADFIVPKDHPQFAELKKLFDEVKASTHKQHIKKELEFPKKIQALVAGSKVNSDLFTDSDIRLRAKNDIRPVVLHKNKTKMTLDEIKEELYSGAYVNVQVSFWGSDKLDGIIGANLHAVQKFRDGDVLSGSAPDMDAFDDLEDEDIEGFDDPDFKDDETEDDDGDL